MWVQLHGEWGSGWVFDGLPNRMKWTITAKPAPPLLVEIDQNSVVTRHSSEDGEGIVVERCERDEITHCFYAIAAMAKAPGVQAGVQAEKEEQDENAFKKRSISRLAIEHCLPATWAARKMDAFFAVHDRDANGRIDFDEFVAMYPALRKVSLLYLPLHFVQTCSQFDVLPLATQDVALRIGMGTVLSCRPVRGRGDRAGRSASNRAEGGWHSECFPTTNVITFHANPSHNLTRSP